MSLSEHNVGGARWRRDHMVDGMRQRFPENDLRDPRDTVSYVREAYLHSNAARGNLDAAT